MTNAPEGWKLVPTTATPEMVRAWRSKAVNASFSDAAYQAILAAAPQPPVQPVKRLTDAQISEIEDWFSNEFGLEAKHSTDFARAIETACATAWGIKLEGDGA